MSLGTTIVSGFVSVVFPCMPIVSVVVVSVGSTLIGVHTLVLVLSMACILVSCLECGGPGDWLLWFPMMDPGLLFSEA